MSTRRADVLDGFAANVYRRAPSNGEMAKYSPFPRYSAPRDKPGNDVLDTDRDHEALVLDTLEHVNGNGSMSAAIRPLTGGVRGHPFSLPEADLTACGYVAEEFVLEGTASSFGPAPGADFAVDGKWDVVVDESAEFRTRMLVVRPRDPDRERHGGDSLAEHAVEQARKARFDLGAPQGVVATGPVDLGLHKPGLS